MPKEIEFVPESNGETISSMRVDKNRLCKTKIQLFRAEED
jgi:hypothetical protein